MLTGGGIDLGLNKVPKVDVMVAVDNRAVEDTDISNIDCNIKDDLTKLSIDTKEAKISKTDTSEIRADSVDFKNIVDTWTLIGANKVGGTGGWEAITDSSGKNVFQYMAINNGITDNHININQKFEDYPQKNLGNIHFKSAIINPDALNQKKFNVSFKIQSNSILNNGFCFCVQPNPIEPNRLNGYFFNFSNHLDYYSSSTYYRDRENGKYRLALWKVENVNFDNCFDDYLWCSAKQGWWTGESIMSQCGGKWTCLANWKINIDNSGFWDTYNISFDKGNIKIDITQQSGEKTLCNISDNTYKYGTYGFWGNNCEQTKGMIIRDFIMEAENSKDYSDILSNQKWRENSIKVVNNIDNQINETLISPSVISQVLNNDINHIMWSSDNMNHILNFLDAIENNGCITFYKKKDILPTS